MSHYAPSLLDKLLGVEGQGPGRSTALRLSVEQVKDSVARDIEAVLNAHIGFRPEQLAGFPMASRSLLTLGMVDITSLSMASDHDRKKMHDAIKNALEKHDMRLKNVQVEITGSSQPGASLSFTIRAELRLSADVEPVAFDAVLQRGSNRCAVSTGRRAAASGTPHGR